MTSLAKQHEMKLQKEHLERVGAEWKALRAANAAQTVPAQEQGTVATALSESAPQAEAVARVDEPQSEIEEIIEAQRAVDEITASTRVELTGDFASWVTQDFTEYH